MQKVSLQQAIKMTGKSESTLRRDVKKGKVSAERDERGHLKFDISELQRAYGELKSTGDDAQSTQHGNDNAMPGHDRAREVALLQNQVDDLRSQLETTETQLQIASSEKTKLLDLLSAEKEEKREIKEEMRALMPPPDERVEKPEQAEIKPRGWLQRLIGVG